MDVRQTVAILQCVLGGFDIPIDPVIQNIPTVFHRFTDDNFPPITGLTPRMQYRIPKTHGWEMFPGYDYYIWLDGTMTFEREDCAQWYLDQLGDADIAFFKHPDRDTMTEEVAHIEDHLKRERPYITARYKNGLHKEQPQLDDELYASTVFIYRNTPEVQAMLKDWWYYGTRYFTCDQVNLSFVLKKHMLKTNKIDQNIYKTKYLSLVSRHK